MKKHFWIAGIVVWFAILACNLPFTTRTAEPHPTQPTAAATISTASALSTFTVVAPTSGIFITSTPIFPVASAIDKPVNCRYGPGVTFSIISGLDVGQRAEITGKSADGMWWQVKSPTDPSTHCWLATSVTKASGNLASVPVANPPEIAVSRIKVTVDRPVLNVSCDAFPQTIHAKAEVTTNGPTTITWRWETSTGDFSNGDPLLYEEAGTRTVEYYYSVGSANDYWIQLHVLTPGDKTGRADFKVNCGP